MNKVGNPTLAYLYRRWLARRFVKDIPPGRFLEIGVGSGHFYEDLLKHGFHGIALDLNSDLIAEHQASALLSTDRMVFRSLDFFLIREQFDLVVAFEVLEHYEQDLVCLARWKELLNPGGTLIFSVPAHMKQWTENDSRAGHARRYEKVELFEKLSKVGLTVHEVWCYGFPLLNLTYPYSSRFRLSGEGTRFKEKDLCNWISETSLLSSAGSEKTFDSLMTNYNSTYQSGTRRFSVFARLLLSEGIWWPFLQLQRFWLNKDRGIGFIVKCHR